MGFFAELKRRHLIKVVIVYVTVGAAVIQGGELLLPRMDVPESTLNLIIAIVVLGFPVALVVAWALEVTPEGVRRTPAADGSASGAAASALAAPAPPDERSVAILPLANLSGDPDYEYFSDGVTEEILMVLSKVQSLKVISRTSVMRFKGSSLSVPQIAAELGVAHVMEGSVRRSGNRVRITAQLIDARTDRHVWAESYDRDLEDIFAIQSDVAQAIVRSLQAALTPAERERLTARPTDDTKAYEAYLEGRHLIVRRTEAALLQGLERLDRAIAADPRFALAWAARAETYALLHVYTKTPRPQALDEARSSARRALELDPGLGEAHAAMGLAAAGARKFEEAEREYKTALALAPGYALAYHWYSNLLANTNRLDEAMRIRERALELDPLSILVLMGYGVGLRKGGREAEAEALYRKALELDPTHIGILGNLASLMEARGRLEEALILRERESRTAPEHYLPELVSAMRTGLETAGPEGYWKGKVDVILSREDSPRNLQFEVMEALAQLGRADEAFAIMERLIAEDHPYVEQIKTEPLLEPLRSDPRYAAMLQRAGLG